MYGLRLRYVVAFGPLLLGACSSSASGPGVDFAFSSARWDSRGFEDYSFVFEQTCECLPTGAVLLAVIDGDVVGAQSLLPDPPVEPDPANFLTIDELFERLRQDAARDPVRFEVTFDDELGYPERAEVDVSAAVADDEYRFEIREVSRMERLE